MVRVAGCDPGTGSLDVVVLEDGVVRAERRWPPDELSREPQSVAAFLRAQPALDLVAAPSGYGLPVVKVADLTERDLALLSLVRGDDTKRRRGVVGFTKVVRSLCTSGLPAVFLPGGIHLPTIPPYRKRNRVDMGTADKVASVALALERLASDEGGSFASIDFILVEVGFAFSAALAVKAGKIVDASCGTAGPVGFGCAGAMDGETAYLFSPLSKGDLFAGGVGRDPRGEEEVELRESVRKCVAALGAVSPSRRTVLSGTGLAYGRLAEGMRRDLAAFGDVELLPSLPGATLKPAAQGAAVIADGLAGGRHRGLVKHLEIDRACGTALDYLRHPKALEARRWFEGGGGESVP